MKGKNKSTRQTQLFPSVINTGLECIHFVLKGAQTLGKFLAVGGYVKLEMLLYSSLLGKIMAISLLHWQTLGFH